MKNTTKLVGLMCCLTWNLSHAQPEPEEHLFYEEYTVENRINYLIPAATNVEALTEWDWIAMNPIKETLKSTSTINRDFERSSIVEYISSDRHNEWDEEPGKLVITSEKSTLYNKEGSEISELPHSEAYLDLESSIKQGLIEEGFTPMLPFPEFSSLPVEELENEGYYVEETPQGYRIFGDSEEYIYNAQEKTRIYNHTVEEFGSPYYIYEAFNTSSQGYLIPAYQRSMTRINSLNGACLVKIESAAYRDYQIYFDPSTVKTQETGNEMASDFNIYPNPASESIQIEYVGNDPSSEDYSIRIANQTGETLLEQAGLSPSVVEDIDISSIPDGYYIIHFHIDDQPLTKNLFKN